MKNRAVDYNLLLRNPKNHKYKVGKRERERESWRDNKKIKGKREMITLSSFF